ncbi:MAG: GNAT family N-acetyltransferase [Candidatus Zixiibacteriota bacterium]
MADKKPKFPTSPSLIGSKVYLRPGTAEDAVNRQYWLLHSEPQAMSCYPVELVTPSEASERFQKREKSTAEQRFAVVRKDDQTPVGEAAFFNYNPQNRSAELGLLIDPDERKKGYGKDAMQLLCRYLFKHRGLNKVYAQTPAFNEAAVGLLKSLGFKKDGTLRDHYFYNGEFHNGYVYSLLLFELDW